MKPLLAASLLFLVGCDDDCLYVQRWYSDAVVIHRRVGEDLEVGRFSSASEALQYIRENGYLECGPFAPLVDGGNP